MDPDHRENQVSRMAGFDELPFVSIIETFAQAYGYAVPDRKAEAIPGFCHMGLIHPLGCFRTLAN